MRQRRASASASAQSAGRTCPVFFLCTFCLLFLLWLLRPSSASTTPLLTLGVIADVQYADAPSALSKMGVQRHYRASLEVLRAAVTAWSSSSEQLSLLVNLGDAVDGREGAGAAVALQLVATTLAQLQLPVHSVLGNHDLYHDGVTRTDWLTHFAVTPAVSASSRDHAYYSVQPVPEVRLIFLDCYEVAVIGRAAEDARSQRAEALLALHNPRAVGNSRNDPSALTGLQRRWVALNGAIGAEQLHWLREELLTSRRSVQRVLIFSHVPLHPQAQSTMCAGMCVVWDYQEVLELLKAFSDVVGACFAGHDHSGGQASENGIHFVTLQGVIESGVGVATFAELKLYRRKALLRGHGRILSRELHFRT